MTFDVSIKRICLICARWARETGREGVLALLGAQPSVNLKQGCTDLLPMYYLLNHWYIYVEVVHI